MEGKLRYRKSRGRALLERVRLAPRCAGRLDGSGGRLAISCGGSAHRSCCGRRSVHRSTGGGLRLRWPRRQPSPRDDSFQASYDSCDECSGESWRFFARRCFSRKSCIGSIITSSSYLRDAGSSNSLPSRGTGLSERTWTEGALDPRGGRSCVGPRSCSRAVRRSCDSVSHQSIRRILTPRELQPDNRRIFVLQLVSMT